MKRSRLSMASIIRSMARRAFGPAPKPTTAKKPIRFSPRIENLEDRTTPATFALSGTTLDVLMSQAGEQLKIQATSAATLTITDSATFTSAPIVGAVLNGPHTILTVTESDFTGGVSVADNSFFSTNVLFTNSGANVYSIPISVTLTAANLGGFNESGNISFVGNSTFSSTSSLSAETTGGSILSAPGSAIVMQAGATDQLTLQASTTNPGTDINLQGSVSAQGGSATASSAAFTALDVFAANNANNFKFDVDLFVGTPINFGAVQLYNSAGLVLGDSALDIASGANVTPSWIASGGAILQDDANNTFLFGEGSGTVNFTAGNGDAIDLDGNLAGAVQNNDFNFTIGATASGDVTIDNGGSTTLGNVTVTGAGTLSVSAEGSISQAAGTVINAGGGTSTFSIDLVAGDITLPNANNFGAQTVVFSDTAVVGQGTIDDVSFRNISKSAAVANVQIDLSTADANTTPGELSELTLAFDAAPIVWSTNIFTGLGLPLGVSGGLALIAGGAISQDATTGLVSAIDLSLNVAGDYPITMNTISNAVSEILINNEGPTNAYLSSTQPISFENQTSFFVGESNLGLGAFSVTADTGNITTIGDITQEEGASSTVGRDAHDNPVAGGTVTFTANDPAAALVQVQGNFTATVNVLGTNVNDVVFDNSNSEASFDNLHLDPNFNNTTTPTLNVEFPDAPIVIDGNSPTQSLTNLTTLELTGDGIAETGAGTLTVNAAGNQATFDSEDFPTVLGSHNNQLNNVAFFSSGRVAVTVINGGAIALNFSNTSNLGSGPLTIIGGSGGVSATGVINQSDAFGNPADPAYISSTGGNIALTGANDFTGAINVPAVSGQSVSLTNAGNLTLGNISTGGVGTLTATSTGGFIEQAPGSVLSANGVEDTFVAGASIDLSNAGNTFGNGATPVDLQSGGGSPVDLVVNGAIELGSVNLGGGIGDLSVQASGAISQITAPDTFGADGITASSATFNAGVGNITLNDANNNMGIVSLSSSGASVLLDDNTALDLGTVTLGNTSLTVDDTFGSISEFGSITQTGPAGLNFTVPAGNNLTLSSTTNDWRGTVTLSGNVGFANVTLDNIGNVAFLFGSGLTFISDDLTIESGGTVTLPGGPLVVGNLSVEAASTTVTSVIAANGGGSPGSEGNISFEGTVNLATGVATLILESSDSTAGSISFDGNVNVTGVGSLQFDFADSTNSSLELSGGTWNEGAHNLTIGQFGISGAVENNFFIGAGGVFQMTGGTIDMSAGEGNLVLDGGTLAVGAAGVADTVTLNNGSGTLDLQNGTFAVGLGSNNVGATNSVLVKHGSGDIIVGQGGLFASLVGMGPVGAFTNTVLDATTDGASIIGNFLNSVNATGAIPFFVGSDIATAATNVTLDGNGNPIETVSVAAAGNSHVAGQPRVTVSATGSWSGTTSSGDPITISSSLGSSAGLVVLQNGADFSVVVRSIANSGNTLTVTTTGSGAAGISTFDGIGIDTQGAATISAANSDIVNDTFYIGPTVDVAGTLSAATVHNTGVNSSGTVGIIANTRYASAAATSSFNAKVMQDTEVIVSVALNSFTAMNVNAGNSLEAASFGTITTAGGSMVVGAGNTPTLEPGNFKANLSTTGGGTTVGTVNVAGTLSGLWDVGGNVGSVTATQTTNWTLGLFGTDGANILNFGGPVNISSLNLGTDSATTINATGALSTFKAVSVDDAQIQVGSVGNFTTTGSAITNDPGDLVGLELTLMGNVSGTALSSMTVAGNLNDSQIQVNNGNIGSVTVAVNVDGFAINAGVSGTSGAIGTLKFGNINGLAVTAKSVGTLSAVGFLADEYYGDVNNLTMSLHGAGTGTALGTLSATGDIINGGINVQNGNVATISARSIGFDEVKQVEAGFAVTLDDPNSGALGTVSANEIEAVYLSANTIGTINSTGVSQTLPRSAGLDGDLSGSTVVEFAPNSTPASASAPSVPSFNLSGDLDNDFLDIPNGIYQLNVGRNMFDTDVVVDNIAAKASFISTGHIGYLTVGAIDDSDVWANTITYVTVKGYTEQQHLSSTTSYFGTVVNSNIFVSDYNTVAPNTFFSVTVQENMSGSTIVALGNLTTLSVGGTLSNSNVITNTTSAQNAAGLAGIGVGTGGSYVGNPVALAGTIGTISAGEIQSDTFDSTSIGTVQATGIAANKFGLGSAQLGSISSTAIDATLASSSTAAIGGISTTGNFTGNTVVSAGQLTNFTIAGTDNQSSVQAGFSATAGVKDGIINANVGAINAGRGVDFVTWYITNFNVKGNASQALAGSILPTSSGNNYNVINVLDNNANVGIANFSATGTIQDTLISVFFGNVGSFTTGMFLESGLIVGVNSFTIGTSELDLAPGGANWNGNYTISSFKTTAAFNVNDIADSASFQNSFTVSFNLGTVTLSGVNTNAVTSDTASFGLFWSGTSGAVKVDGSATALVSSGSAQNIAPQAGSIFFYE